MVNFVSLFLGLVLGPQTISLNVAEAVTRVELRLNGRLVAELDGPPWSGRVDLGEELAPHELAAVAFDREENVIGRASQWLNLPRQPAEANIVLEGGHDGRDRVARVSWESLVEAEPSKVRAIFDGLPLEVADPRRILLPAHDPSQLHFLRVELEFADFVSSTAEITFGGTYADQVNSELTAFPIQLEGRRKIPPATELRGWFSKHGQQLGVAAVEKGLAEVVVVRDRGAWDQLRGVRSMALADPYVGSRGWFRSSHSAWRHWTFQFLWPISRRLTGTDGPYDVFPHSQKYTGESGSLHGWATMVELPSELDGGQRLSDAVAVAGVSAASGNRRRAVLLILGDSPDDTSDITPWMAQRYLRRLNVPLFVWTSHGEPTGTTRLWAGATDVSSSTRMRRATQALFKALENQRVVWIEGIHLPQDVALASQVRGVRLLRDLEETP